ncbi:MAG: biotin--[acetyl-CoA-carboxylase] ligase [Steroidobacteraceae bacterium]
MSSGGAPLAARVHAQLSAGGFVSGADLAHRLGVSRNAIWKSVVALRALGLEVHAVRNRGYRLPIPCEPLDAAAIRAALAVEVRRRIRRLETVWTVESTNAALLTRTDLPAGLADVFAAEYQTAGRGRLGRAWLAPPGGAICLSIGWSFPQLPRDLAALGLAIGVCALRALRGSVPEEPRAAPGGLRSGEAAAGLRRLSLKWPNDLTIGDRKLGGILIEMRAESAGPTYVVIGIGVNLALGARLAEQVAATGTLAVDLASTGAEPGRRNAIIAALCGELIGGLTRFQQDGLRPFADEWAAADSLRDRAVSARTGEQTLRGIARGIDASGALLVETPQGLQKLLSGDVTVRPAEERIE